MKSKIATLGAGATLALAGLTGIAPAASAHGGHGVDCTKTVYYSSSQGGAQMRDVPHTRTSNDGNGHVYRQFRQQTKADGSWRNTGRYPWRGPCR